MPLIAKILISGLIIAAITVGGVIVWKMSSQPAPDLTTAAILKANDIDNSITVPFATPVVLSWESKNVGDCLISGDWYSPVSNSGSQSVGEIKKSTNYIFVCVDNEGKEVSDSITVNIDEKTIPQNVLLTDLFKDFRYLWKKELCLGLTNDPDVVALQTALFFEGIFSPQEKITGNYDNDTLLAVKKFQENYSIVPQTGCVGPQTIAKLNALFYYYNYSDQVASQESSQKQITATNQKISLYQQTKIAPTPTPPTPTPIISITPTSTKIIPKTPPATSIITTTARPFVDIKINNSSRSSITVKKGETATLTWTSRNAKSCIASGNWSGSKPILNSTGEITTPINKYATFKLTCTGENDQNAADSVYVSVPYISVTPTKESIIPTIDSFKGLVGITVYGSTIARPRPNPVEIKGKNFTPHTNKINCDSPFPCKIYGKENAKNGELVSKGAGEGGEESIEFYIIAQMPASDITYKIELRVENENGESNETEAFVIRPSDSLQ
ncbi:MAG: peptidoglycan-binding domain-containing protein, partial [Patescibacteria group bacterium]